jgi:hypothetical protein
MAPARLDLYAGLSLRDRLELLASSVLWKLALCGCGPEGLQLMRGALDGPRSR